MFHQNPASAKIRSDKNKKNEIRRPNLSSRCHYRCTNVFCLQFQLWLNFYANPIFISKLTLSFLKKTTNCYASAQ